MNYIIPPTNYPVPSKKVAPDLPDYPLPEGFGNENAYLEYLVRQGAEQLYGTPVPDHVIDRVNFELEIIKDKSFTNYFLIVADMVCAAQERFNILVGPGRGSAPGSLVCYCLGITKVDPLKHDLLFERFICPDRDVLPDIDIDYEDGAQDILVCYLKEKYGESCVSHIITYNRTKDKERTIIGHGVHACGIALSNMPTSYYSPLTKVDNTIVTIYDGHHIEEAGPVKIDILDFNELTKIHKILDIIKKDKGIEVNIDRIPIDDPSTLDAFANAETNGIFLFWSGLLKEQLMKLKSPTFEDLCAIHTLYRPGLIESVPEYISRKNGTTVIEYPLPIMEKYLKETYGMMIYQEQIMLLSRCIANFSRQESDECRKAIGKLKKDKLDLLHQKFLDGGESNGHSKELLDSIWSEWCKTGLYLFNKSHAVSYTFMAYQMMYLKVHFPDEFYMVISNTK